MPFENLNFSLLLAKAGDHSIEKQDILGEALSRLRNNTITFRQWQCAVHMLSGDENLLPAPLVHNTLDVREFLFHILRGKVFSIDRENKDLLALLQDIKLMTEADVRSEKSDKTIKTLGRLASKQGFNTGVNQLLIIVGAFLNLPGISKCKEELAAIETLKDKIIQLVEGRVSLQTLKREYPRITDYSTTLIAIILGSCSGATLSALSRANSKLRRSILEDSKLKNRLLNYNRNYALKLFVPHPHFICSAPSTCIQNIMELDVEEKTPYLVELAKQEFKAGRYEQAKSTLKEALRLNGHEKWESLADIAVIYTHISEPKMARECLSQIPEEEIQSRTRILLSLYKFEEDSAAATKLLKEIENNIEKMINCYKLSYRCSLANTHYFRGEYQEAEISFEAAKYIASTYKEKYRHLTKIGLFPTLEKNADVLERVRKALDTLLNNLSDFELMIKDKAVNSLKYIGEETLFKDSYSLTLSL